MEFYGVVKWLHIISATVLFGTGIGTAFQMWMSHLGGDVRAIAQTADNVVRADWLFTATSGVLQPVTGIALIVLGGHDPFDNWLMASYALFALALACWLPVVWLQYRVRTLARAAAATQSDLYQFALIRTHGPIFGFRWR